MSTTEREIVVDIEDGSGERVLVIVDDAVTDERAVRDMAPRLGGCMLSLAAAFVNVGDAAREVSDRMLAREVTCVAEPVYTLTGRPGRRLPGPVPDRIVRRAMRGRGWQR